MHVDHRYVKLGKKKPHHVPGTPVLRDYVKEGARLVPPPSVTNSHGVTDWGMMLNGPNNYGQKVPSGGIGDCTIAGPAHGEQVWTVNTRPSMVSIPDAAVLAKYETWDGYVPGDSATDQGGVIRTVLSDWLDASFPGCFCLDSFAAIHGTSDPAGNPTFSLDRDDVKISVWLFGGALIGLAMPAAWQNAALWDVGPANDPTYAAGSWGGHCVWIADYNVQGPVVITWGYLQQITWPGFLAYCDEAYAPISKDWMTASWVSPVGLDLATLKSDLQQVE